MCDMCPPLVKVEFQLNLFWPPMSAYSVKILSTEDSIVRIVAQFLVRVSPHGVGSSDSEALLGSFSWKVDHQPNQLICGTLVSS